MLATLLNLLRGYLPSAGSSTLPDSLITVINLVERPAGLGSWIGQESRGGFTAIAVKGTQLDTTLRFQLWAAQQSEVNMAIAALQQQVLADRNFLRSAGILRLIIADTAKAEFDTVANAWSQTTDLAVLFEAETRDADGAEGLIARIPVESSLPFADSTTVTGHLTQWSEVTAPTLTVQGPFILQQLSALVLTPLGTPPSGSVTITRTVSTAAGPPQSFGTLPEFLAAVSGPVPLTRHAQVAPGSLTAFLNTMTAVGDPIVLGNRDEDSIPDAYQARVLSFESAIHLTSVRDRLDVAYGAPAFDQSAVVYLRGG